MPNRHEDRNHEAPVQGPSTLHLINRSERERHDPAIAAPPGMRFRLVADFTIDGGPLPELYANGDLNEAEKSLVRVITSNPEAFNRICRLVLPCDLTTHEGVFEGKFSGPDWIDIFEAILPYLPPEDQAYWIRLRCNSVDDVDSFMDFIFSELKGSLESLILQDASTGEEIPCQVSSRPQRGKA